MRLYRGKRKDNGEWAKGYYFVLNQKSYIFRDLSYPNKDVLRNSVEVIPETVGQSTGLKDKDDKELDWWKDDLLRLGSDHPNAPIGKIMYDEWTARWVIVSKGYVQGMSTPFCGLVQAYLNGWKKIGNIYEE